MNPDDKQAEKLIKQYALALNTLDVEPIVLLLHKHFKFSHFLVHGGTRMKTDIRYLGHLCKTFAQMKIEGWTTIRTVFCELDAGGMKLMGIKLLPPHDGRIIFPMVASEKDGLPTPQGEVILLPHIKDGLLYQLDCYHTLENFNQWGGKVLQPI